MTRVTPLNGFEPPVFRLTAGRVCLYATVATIKNTEVKKVRGGNKQGDNPLLFGPSKRQEILILFI